MRVVIDTNSLETEELRIFLSSRRRNIAVLPEHTSAEIFKPSSDEAVFALLSTLCEFPKQVILLRGNRYAATVDARVPAISNRFIDRDISRSFPQFCGAVRAANSGHTGYLQQLAQRREWALERAETVESALGDQSDSLAELRDQFTAADLQRLRAGEALSERSRQLILGMTTAIAKILYVGHPARRPLQKPPYRYYQFTWRYALCHLIQLIQLIRDGGIRRAAPKARNDHFDNVFSTFGTYYNGVMTNDKGPLATQCIARIILRSLGVRLSEDYVETGYILTLIDDLDANF